MRSHGKYCCYSGMLNKLNNSRLFSGFTFETANTMWQAISFRIINQTSSAKSNIIGFVYLKRYLQVHRLIFRSKTYSKQFSVGSRCIVYNHRQKAKLVGCYHVNVCYLYLVHYCITINLLTLKINKHLMHVVDIGTLLRYILSKLSFTL